MTRNALGRLEQITDLRGVWESEAGSFTPWLSAPRVTALDADDYVPGESEAAE